jgi:Zn ribbon nucleic-acid-binding protein
LTKKNKIKNKGSIIGEGCPKCRALLYFYVSPVTPLIGHYTCFKCGYHRTENRQGIKPIIEEDMIDLKEVLEHV